MEYAIPRAARARGAAARARDDRAARLRGAVPDRDALRRARRRLPQHRPRARHLLHRGPHVPAAWPGSRTSAPSRRSWTPTAAARTGASATSSRPRRSRRATRSGTASRRCARASTPAGVFQNEYSRARARAGRAGRRSRGSSVPRRGRSVPRRRSRRPATRWSDVEALAQLARLGVAEVDAVADRQRGAPARRAAASAPRPRPRSGRGAGRAGGRGVGQPARLGRGPRRGSRRRARSRSRGAGLRTTGSANIAAGRSRKARVGVEQRGRVEARAGRELGDGGLARSSGARLPVPPPFTNSSVRHLGHRRDDGGAALGDLARGAPLQRTR